LRARKIFRLSLERKKEVAMKSRKGLGILSLMILAAFPAPAPSQTPEAMKVLDQCSPGSVAIAFFGENKQEIARGTAFALSEDVVVTSYHLVSRAFDAEATNAKGKKLRVEGVVAVSKPSPRPRARLQPSGRASSRSAATRRARSSYPRERSGGSSSSSPIGDAWMSP
jgi:hypothetical protein